MIRTFVALSVVAIMASAAMGGQIYYDNYTDGVDTSKLDPNGRFAGQSILGQQTIGGLTYLGGVANQTGESSNAITIAPELQTLPAGYVWFVKAAFMSDVVSNRDNYFSTNCITLDLVAPDPNYNYYVEGGGTAKRQIGAVHAPDWRQPPDHESPGNTDTYYGAPNALYGDVGLATIDQNMLGTGRSATFVFRPNTSSDPNVAGKTIQETGTGDPALAGTALAFERRQTNTTFVDTVTMVRPQIWTSTGNPFWSAGETVTASNNYNTRAGVAAGSNKSVAWSTIDPNLVRRGYTSLEIGQTVRADFNLDYKVNIDDASVLIGPFWGNTSGTMTQMQGDATGDGKVNLDDASAMIDGSVWTQTFDQAAGVAEGSVDGSGNILIDAKGIALYQVFVGNAAHEKVATAGDLLTYDPNRTAARNLSVWGALTNDFQVNPTAGNPEYFGAVNTAVNSIGTATATFAYDEDLNIVGITGWGTNGIAKDTYVNVDVAALQAAGLGLWMEYKTLGGTSEFQAIIPVPEPVTMSLLALGGLGLLARRRRNG